MTPLLLFILMYLATLAFIGFIWQEQAKERKQLYDRIQSKDFVEYKSFEPIPKPEPKEEPEHFEYL